MVYSNSDGTLCCKRCPDLLARFVLVARGGPFKLLGECIRQVAKRVKEGP